MKFTKIFSLLSIIAVLTFSSCTKEKTPLVIPTTYDSPDFSKNVTQEAGLRKQLSSLTSYMKKGENVNNKLSLDSLNQYFSNNGNPSLASIVQPYYKSLISSKLFNDLVNASKNSLDINKIADSPNGGVFGNRLLDKGGKETLQEIEKGLYTAALYSQLNTIGGSITSVTDVDRMISIYGAHPNFPNTNTASKTPTPDAFIALYAARRDKADGKGLYTQIQNQFIKLKAAVAAGADYDTEKNEALKEINSLMEKALMATVVHYGFTGVSKLTKTNPSATDLSGGLHDLGEAVGFVHGFRSLPTSMRKISDAQIDEILNLLLAPIDKTSTMYTFVTDGVNKLPNITSYQDKIKSIYGFTTQEIEEFKNNWIAVQGR
jgi:hypothetical protein